MKEIITTGKTVELAIEEACQQMNVSREKVEFEIIDLPKKALFGPVSLLCGLTQPTPADTFLLREKYPKAYQRGSVLFDISSD